MRRSSGKIRACLAFSFLLPFSCLVPSDSPGGDAALAGPFTMDPPTFVCLGAKWIVRDDDNSNARIEVEYRKAGGKWVRGPDMFRVESAAVPEPERPKPGERLYAGSILDLHPDTSYHLRFKLKDPDGGNLTVETSMRTRVLPHSHGPGRILHVAPGTSGGAGSKSDPFHGLATADAAAKPGDTILVHAGLYEGTWEVKTDGLPGRPITWRPAGDGGVFLDARGAERSISASDRHDLVFEDFCICNAQFLVVFHRAKRITIRRCHIHGGPYGIVAHGQENGRTIEDLLIEDNLIEGPSFWPRTMGIENARGVQVAGTGITVRHNRITGFADGIDTFHSYPCAAIDIYGNEISEMTDDGIETDYSVRNVRVFNNRLTNVFMGISAQPVYGGPVYILRNAMYNVEASVFKLHNSPSGVLMYHNTAVKAGMPASIYPGLPIRNCVSRNNLFVGTSAQFAFESTAPMIDCDFDYDAFGGGPWPMFMKWNERRYPDLEEVKRGAPVYRHALLVNPANCFHSRLLPPADARAQAFPTKTNDLRLSGRSQARNKGARIPGINDNYEGNAPDLGAYEYGQSLPLYGPRPQ